MLTAFAAQVIVTVTGIGEPTGDLFVQVCSRETFLTGACEHRARLEPRDGEFVFEAVEPGLWAVTGWHDAEGDGVMRRGLFGMPSEPTAISNNPPALFGPPRFEDAAFTHSSAPVRIALEF